MPRAIPRSIRLEKSLLWLAASLGRTWLILWEKRRARPLSPWCSFSVPMQGCTSGGKRPPKSGLVPSRAY
eukprot:3828808-Pyramimonas_sp.AAC.1